MVSQESVKAKHLSGDCREEGLEADVVTTKSLEVSSEFDSSSGISTHAILSARRNAIANRRILITAGLRFAFHFGCRSRKPIMKEPFSQIFTRLVKRS